MSYRGKRTKDGLPDRRTSAGRLWFKRSEAAKQGWITRRKHEKEKEWKTGGGAGYKPDEILVEEPIETVGGPRTKSGKRRK